MNGGPDPWGALGEGLTYIVVIGAVGWGIRWLFRKLSGKNKKPEV